MKLLRHFISAIVDNKYQVSVVNSYIKGCNIEWDLLIVTNDVSEDEINYNVYYPEHVVCALEFKTNGAVFKKSKEKSIAYLEKYVNMLDAFHKKNANINIKYAYVSLYEISDNLISMREKYKDNCFWLIEGYYGSRHKKEVRKNRVEDFEKFLQNLLT